MALEMVQRDIRRAGMGFGFCQRTVTSTYSYKAHADCYPSGAGFSAVGALTALRERGLPIYDLGDVFANEKGKIYADHIHYWRDSKSESPGNRLMARRIADQLAETWGLQKK